jgi:hypothetical protein
LRYKNGLFLPEPGMSSLKKAAREQQIEDMFLTLLRKLTEQHRPVSPAKNSPSNYAPPHVHGHETREPAARKPTVPHWVFRAEISEIPRSNDNVTFLELEPHHCRYPIGDPKTKEFRFCGALRLDNMPYCARCLEIAPMKRYGRCAESRETVAAD